MRDWMRLAIFTATLLMLACSEDGSKDYVDLDSGVDGGDDEGYDPRFQPVVDAVEAELEAMGAPGAAVAIIEGGEVTFAKGFGSKSPDMDDPVDAETLFRVGSTTKMLTAVGLLRQVEAGDASLDDAVTDHLPTFSFDADATWAPSITLKDLLTHTHGMVDYLEIDAAATYQSDDGLSNYLLGEFGTYAYLMAPAGAMWNYSNPGYYFAGLITEELSDEHYRDYLLANVFSPLSMNRTFFLGDEVVADGDYALGLSSDESGNPTTEGPQTYDNPWARPAGYAWSSVLDLAQMVKFFRDGDTSVLEEETRQEMISGQVDMECDFGDDLYGYGVFVTEGLAVADTWYPTLKVIEHGGDINGYAADLYYFPDLDFGFVALANMDGAHLDESIETALTTLTDLPEGEDMPVYAPTAEDLAPYLGSYNDPHNVGPVEITADGDTLKISAPVLDNYGYTYTDTLYPYAPDNFAFIIEGAGYLLTFIFDDTSDTQAQYTRLRFSVAERDDSGGAKGLALPSPEAVRRALETPNKETSPSQRRALDRLTKNL